MTPAEHAALSALRFNVAPTPADLWKPSRYDVPELHSAVVSQILGSVKEARQEATNPIGVIAEGRPGSGKTHMLGAVRETIQHDGGYFFLVQAISSKTFWENTVGGMIDGLQRDAMGWGTQLKTYL